MKSVEKILLLFFVGITFCTFSCAKDVLSSKQFTGAFMLELKKVLPGSEIFRMGDLELKVKNQGPSDYSVFLGNAYDSYKQDPSQKQDVIDLYVGSIIETLNYNKNNIDINRIVPVIKDRPWIDEIIQSISERGAQKLPDNVFDNYNSELIIIYAEDTSKNIRYITNEDFKKLGIDRKELGLLAVQNLQSILPKIGLVGGRVIDKAGFTREGVLRSSVFKDGKVLDQFLYSHIGNVLTQLSCNFSGPKGSGCCLNRSVILTYEIV